MSAGAGGASEIPSNLTADGCDRDVGPAGGVSVLVSCLTAVADFGSVVAAVAVVGAAALVVAVASSDFVDAGYLPRMSSHASVATYVHPMRWSESRTRA